MKFHPYSIEQAPRTLPVWQSILEDLGNPPAARVAKVLGLGVRTVYRYNRAGSAPRHVCLALFWLTRWGHSAVYTQAVNDCQLAVAYATAMESQVRTLRTKLAHVLAISDPGSANEPLAGDDHVGGR